MPAKLMTDELFEAQLLRAIGYAPYRGADAGECLAVAGQISGHDLDSWHGGWTAAAARLAGQAEASAASGDAVSAGTGSSAPPTISAPRDCSRWAPRSTPGSPRRTGRKCRTSAAARRCWRCRRRSCGSRTRTPSCRPTFSPPPPAGARPRARR